MHHVTLKKMVGVALAAVWPLQVVGTAIADTIHHFHHYGYHRYYQHYGFNPVGATTHHYPNRTHF